MTTIVEPKQHIAKLWGKQSVKPEETYRLMRYVLRVDHEGRTALHNNVTGQLVMLDEQEAKLIDQLPLGFAPEMASLIEQHYLVPESYDEHQQVINLRTILRTLRPKSKYITHYTILPTTACNARCYYCFEQGIKPVTMTEQTANDVVKFIAEHCGPEKKVSITWFGGEPTVASNRIDQISRGLREAGITYSSMMYTNGYLFDEEMVGKAVDLWHLTHVQMSIDGTEKVYNWTKAYVNVSESPYQRVMHNIGLLINCKINVAVRMNVDIKHYSSMCELVDDLADRFHDDSFLRVYAYYLIGSHEDHDGLVCHGDDKWM